MTKHSQVAQLVRFHRHARKRVCIIAALQLMEVPPPPLTRPHYHPSCRLLLLGRRASLSPSPLTRAGSVPLAVGPRFFFFLFWAEHARGSATFFWLNMLAVSSTVSVSFAGQICKRGSGRQCLVSDHEENRVAALPLVSAILGNLRRAIKELHPKKKARSRAASPEMKNEFSRKNSGASSGGANGPRLPILDLPSVRTSISPELPSTDPHQNKRLLLQVGSPLHLTSAP